MIVRYNIKGAFICLNYFIIKYNYWTNLKNNIYKTCKYKMNLFLKIIIIYSLFLSPLFSQFGKNKVQYEQFDWSFIKTEHFDIYYYNEGKEQAEFVAYYSEEAYKKIANLIGW